MGIWWPRLDVGILHVWRLPVVLGLWHGLLVVAQNVSLPPSTTVPDNGTGAAYASACQSAYLDFSSSAWTFSQESKAETTHTLTLGGTRLRSVTYYANATTLCDGHARVQSSESLVPLSSTLLPFHDGPVSYITTTDTSFPYYSRPTPSCSIKPSDCDPLWQSYTTSLAAWEALLPPQITVAPPFTPPCTNVSAYESYTSALSSVRACGPCTIYGDHVQLLYFPTSASRDMCASTPTATVTSFDIDATPLDIYTGKGRPRGPYDPSAVTAVVDGHTFTSNTAYVSIGAVWASDRCDKRIGTTILDVVVALQPESVLSVRYSHPFTYYFQESSVQTGYPVSYADFIQPIPWSAWNGQAVCGGPCYGCGCDVIFEDQFFPQLAVPPGLRQLNKLWSTCQFAYWGLHDPPLTLTSQASFAVPTFTATTTTRPVQPVPEMPAPASTTANAVAQTATPPLGLEKPEQPQANPAGAATGLAPGATTAVGGQTAGSPAGGAAPAANPGLVGVAAAAALQPTTDGSTTGGVGIIIHGDPAASVTGGGDIPTEASESPVTAGPTLPTFATPSRSDDGGSDAVGSAVTLDRPGSITSDSSAVVATSDGGGGTTTSDSSVVVASARRTLVVAAALAFCSFGLLYYSPPI